MIESARYARGLLVDNVIGRRDRAASAEFKKATSSIPSAAAYGDLHPRSLSIAAAWSKQGERRAVNLVLPQFSEKAVFAGIRTAIDFALELASLRDLDVRLIALSGRLSARRRSHLGEYVRRNFGRRADPVISICEVRDLISEPVGESDIWVVTHWTTAHAASVATELGRLDPARVIYLVQDYEPGFVAWSDEFALARSTYHAGFHAVVNSSLLWKYLSEVEHVDILRERVFRPRLDLARLERSFNRRSRRPAASVAKVLFYARPGKPRNLFSIGMSAIDLFVKDCAREGLEVEVATVGSAHGLPPNDSFGRVKVLGQLDWNGYFDALADADVVLSLQHSPHPSHPPLDAVVSGALSVTNEFGGARSALSESLLAVEPAPREVSGALRRYAELAAGSDRGSRGFRPEVLLSLGGEFSDVIGGVSDAVG